MWNKISKYRDLASSFTKVEIISGVSRSFWFDAWSPLGWIYDLTNDQYCIDLRLNINATVEYVVQQYRCRYHRNEHLILIKNDSKALATRSHCRTGFASMERGKIYV